MYLKIQKFYSASNDSGGTITLDVEKVKSALSKFDDIRSSLVKINGATKNVSSIKPRDLISGNDKTNFNSIDYHDVFPVTSEGAYNKLSSSVYDDSTVEYLFIKVIDRVKDLCNAIIKADTLYSSSDDDNSDDVNFGFGVPPTGDSADITISGQYTVQDVITGTDKNGNAITINPGNYDIVDVKKDANGVITDICILVNGERVWISLKDNNISNDNTIDIVYGQYTIESTITITDKNGNIITINPGNYNIVDVKKDANGMITDICILVNGERVWLSIKNQISGGIGDISGEIGDISGGIGDISGGNINVSGGSGNIELNKGQYTIENTITITDKNGNVITIKPGNYEIVDVKKDANGVITDICILVNGEKIWLSIKNGVSNGNNNIDIDKGQYTVENTITITDKNGNVITIKPGNYEIVDVKKDVNGIITDICIIVNGEKVWLKVINNKVVVNDNELGIENKQYTLNETIIITDMNGNKITITPGNYDIVDVKTDSNGNVNAICIMVDNNRVWLVFENEKIVKVLLQTSHNSVFVFENATLNIYDANGNIVGTVNDGKYYVYEVLVDNNGNINWIRISKDGAPEYWVNVYFNETAWGRFLTFENEIERKSGVLSFFKDNKGPFIGVLGILAVGLGAIMYSKKSNKRKNVDSGTFAVYEVGENDEGEIDEVRVSPDNYDEEYWIKF